MIITFSLLVLLIFALLKKSWIWHIFHHEKVVYLTFDDGPQEELTQEILQILRQENIKATFFCVGDAAGRYPHLMEQIRRAIAEDRFLDFRKEFYEKYDMTKNF